MDRISSNEPGLVQWLCAPDRNSQNSLADFTRGALRSYALADKGTASKVHINRVRLAFQQIGAPALTKHGLRLLALLGEAEDVGHGYWVLSPHRTVAITAGRWAFVGAVPTEELLDGDVLHVGLARLLRSPIEGLASQSLDAWSCATRLTPHDLAKRALEHHLRTRQRTIASETVEYLSVAEGGTALRWSPTQVPFAPNLPIALCRQRDAYGVRYFSRTPSTGAAVDEAQLLLSPSEIVPCLASAAGTPIRVQIRQVDGNMVFAVPRPLSLSLRRAFLLLGDRRSANPASIKVSVSAEIAPALSSLLSNARYKVDPLP